MQGSVNNYNITPSPLNGLVLPHLFVLRTLQVPVAKRMQSLLRVRMTSVVSLLLIMTILSFGCSLDIDFCQSEQDSCKSNAACRYCASVLEVLLESSEIDKEFTTCSALFEYGCSVAETNGCNADNVYVLELARCLAEEEFGCTGFTSC